MKRYELVIVWTDGTTDVYGYDTRDAAENAGRGMCKALGNQITWYGVRPIF